LSRRPVILAALPVVVASVSLVTLASPDRAFAQGSGAVDGWGSYLGAITPDTKVSPTPVAGLTDVVTVDAGNANTYALQCAGGTTACSTDGTVGVWGSDKSGELGNGTVSSADGPWMNTPVQANFPAGVFITAIGESDDGAYAIDSTGQGWAWGNDQCGGGTGSVQEPTPVAVTGVTNALAVQGGQGHVLWLLNNGTVASCGNNMNGDLGDGSTTADHAPTVISGLSDVVQVSAGNVTSAAVTSSGDLYMWGSNSFGQLGVNSATIKKEKVPTRITLPAPVAEVSAGGSERTSNGSTIALLDNSKVFAWGNNAHGQLGNGGTTNEYAPVKVHVPAGITFTEVVTGGFASYGLDSSGGVWAWGYGDNGQLGNGSSGPSDDAPTPIEVDSGATAVSSTANNVADLH
jgi:alpha-tubulin suppressor-like RCC1 family protein